MVEYLHTVAYATGHKNILEDLLFTAYRTMEFVVMTRSNAIINLRISHPMRWLTGKAAALDNCYVLRCLVSSPPLPTPSTPPPLLPCL